MPLEKLTPLRVECFWELFDICTSLPSFVISRRSLINLIGYLWSCEFLYRLSSYSHAWKQIFDRRRKFYESVLRTFFAWIKLTSTCRNDRYIRKINFHIHARVRKIIYICNIFNIIFAWKSPFDFLESRYFSYWIVTFSSFLSGATMKGWSSLLKLSRVRDIQFPRNTVDSLELSISWISI